MCKKQDNTQYNLCIKEAVLPSLYTSTGILFLILIISHSLKSDFFVSFPHLIYYKTKLLYRRFYPFSKTPITTTNFE